MSPGATMHRAYVALKARILRGEFKPGQSLDPVELARSLGVSATPVRDALHFLSGERIIDFNHHVSFRQPIVREAALQDLYRWSATLLSFALTDPLSDLHVSDVPRDSEGGYYPDQVSTLFQAIASLKKSDELSFAIENLVDRSRVFRLAEVKVDPLCQHAVAEMAEDLKLRRWKDLRSEIRRFHRRRSRLAGQVVAEIWSHV